MEMPGTENGARFVVEGHIPQRHVILSLVQHNNDTVELVAKFHEDDEVSYCLGFFEGGCLNRCAVATDVLDAFDIQYDMQGRMRIGNH